MKVDVNTNILCHANITFLVTLPSLLWHFYYAHRKRKKKVNNQVTKLLLTHSLSERKDQETKCVTFRRKIHSISWQRRMLLVFFSAKKSHHCHGGCVTEVNLFFLSLITWIHVFCQQFQLHSVNFFFKLFRYFRVTSNLSLAFVPLDELKRKYSLYTSDRWFTAASYGTLRTNW